MIEQEGHRVITYDICTWVTPPVAGRLGSIFLSFLQRRVLALRAMPVAQR